MSNDTAAFLFYPRPMDAVHAAAQNMSLSVLFHPPKGRRSTDFRVCRPVPGNRKIYFVLRKNAQKRPLLHTFRPIGYLIPRAPHAIDISECTFFALLIYQFKDSHPGFLSCCSSTMYATVLRSETECLQNYCKIRRSSYDASQFSMQNSEVYMLHSFSSQVYSFQRRRQFLRENKSNICTFFV